MTIAAKAQAPEKLLYRMNDLPAILRISKTEIHRRIKAGTFPKGTHLAPQVVVWNAETIRKWVNEFVP